MQGRGQISLVTLHRASGDLQGQIYQALRARILDGSLPAGARLPSTRQLAASLGVARATVVVAYERLVAEGYVLNAAGRASRVAHISPPVAPAPLTALLPVAAVTATAIPVCAPLLLTPGVPDLASFPSFLWGRLLASQARRLPTQRLGYGDEFGLPALKETILAHLAVRRGVVATSAQLVLLPSTRTAIAMIARVVLRRYGSAPAPVWVEDPVYPGARRILEAEGGRLVPVSVDPSGLNVEQTAHLPAPRLIYVTPSHQYPTGVTMSLSRRLRLLALARQNGAFILEDDYDSEFQFDGRPIAALQGIDQADCVAYLGTLSKVLAPGVRLAYAVIPHCLLVEVQKAIRVEGIMVSTHVQAAFLAFLREGHFSAHIRRMTRHYAARMAAFRAALEHACSDLVRYGSGAGGLQLALWFKNQHLDDKLIAAILQPEGYAPVPLSTMYAGEGGPGLLCGIANLLPAQAPAAARAIAASLQPQTIML